LNTILTKGDKGEQRKIFHRSPFISGVTVTT